MKKIKHQSGITLLEVMISMIVLAIGILGLAPLISMSIYGNTFADDVTVANALAQQEVEILMNESDYGQILFYSTTDSVNGMYLVNRVVEDDISDAMIPLGLYKISVDIGWVDQQNQQRTVTYSTFKTKI